MKNYVKLIGIALLTAAMVFALVSCSDGGGGGGGSIPAPNNVTGFFGVTGDGQTIEVTNTTAPNGRAITTTGWQAGDGYVVRVNGVEKSRGLVAEVSGSTITFTPNVGTLTISTTGTITINNGVTITGTVAATVPDNFFAIGAGTRMT